MFGGCELVIKSCGRHFSVAAILKFFANLCAGEYAPESPKWGMTRELAMHKVTGPHENLTLMDYGNVTRPVGAQ
jgi:hypothetical protein